MKKLFFARVFFLVLCYMLSACSDPKPARPSFDGVAGIKFTEVRRAYDTGSMISRNGFQQKPEWILYFIKKDKAKIYSPREKRFIEYPIYYDHDSVFNFAREWFRMKVVTKDSVILQLLKVESNREISQEMSNVYMKFYSDGYLAKLGADPEKLKLPNRFDTLYVQRKADTANRFPDSLKHAFAATTPVRFTSRSPYIHVSKLAAEESPLEDPSPADFYLKPEYNVAITGTFKDFRYSYVATIDDKAKIHVLYSLDPAENMVNRLETIGLVNRYYLEKYLTIEPGTTLGIRHTTKIVLHVKGEK